MVHTQSAWLPVSVKFPIYRRMQGYFEVQSRFQKEDDSGPFCENQIRTGVGRSFGKNWSAFVGYFWSPHYDEWINHEQRVWEQLTWQKKYGAVTLQNRFRCEEIWREAYRGASVRVRNQLRVTRDLGRSPYYLAVSEEPMFNMNTRPDGPQQGFTQNRLFVGIGKRINWCTRFEVGYLNQYRNSRNATPDLMNHVIVASLAFDFTASKPKKKPQSEYKLASESSGLSYAPQLVMKDLYSPTSMYFAHGGAHPSLPYHPSLAGLAHRHI
jgi:hypothetical protein